jgi:branched-chain amino acid transport system substrate-binding protein
MKKISRTTGVLLMALILAGLTVSLSANSTSAAGPLKEYVMPTFIDGSGVYAELYTTTVLPATQAAYEGWNKDVGEKLGIKVVNKVYDTRYDFSEAANLYDRSVINDKPVAVNSLVSPATLANLKKFAANKTPAIQWFGYGGMHLPGAWAFLPGRAYVIHYASAIEWLATKEWKESRKPRIAFAIFSGVYGKDTIGIMEPWLKQYDKIEYVGAFWHDTKPVDLSGYVRDMMKSKPDFVMLSTTSVSLSAYYNALKELGFLGKVVNVHPTYQGLDVAGKILGFDSVEGDFGIACANASSGTKAHEYFTKYANKYYSGAFWGSTTVAYSAGTYMLLSAIANAAKKAGPSNVTGQAVFDQLEGQEFTADQLAGVASGAKLNPNDRLSGVKDLYMYKAKGGKEIFAGQVPAEEDPILKAWLKDKSETK